jgi:uncharacterized protein (DUF433 family)
MKRRIVSDPEILSGTPVFRGTRIPLDHVAGLIRKGASATELREDFPALTKSDFDYARRHARTSKATRRSHKSLEIRKATRAA